jgi:uncharacterized protein (UPF0210 family)
VRKIYEKIVSTRVGLVKTGEDIEKEFGITIRNKRFRYTIALVADSSKAENSYHSQRSWTGRKGSGVNFFAGFQAGPQSFTSGQKTDRIHPEALTVTDRVCSSVMSPHARRINMDALSDGRDDRLSAENTKTPAHGCASLCVC